MHVRLSQPGRLYANESRIGAHGLDVGAPAIPHAGPDASDKLVQQVPQPPLVRDAALDPFRRTSCRRLERELIPWYEGVLEELLESLRSGAPLEKVLSVAEAPDRIRGFEHVKEASARQVRDQVGVEIEQLRTVRA